jgi:uncharacterized protein YjbJ (UPF0337 family)
MTNDKAEQAREGLMDSVAGKVKEVAGAVSGRDDLVEEGQLQQAEARNRKEAVADEAIADATRDEARQDMREASQDAAQDKGQAYADAARAKIDVERERESEHANAAREAHLQEAAGLTAAEARADEVAASGMRDAEAIAEDADLTEQNAVAEKRRLESEADAAEQKAAELRAQTKE